MLLLQVRKQQSFISRSSKSGITDQEGNTTRFVIVTNTRKFVKNAQKISIVFETANEQVLDRPFKLILYIMDLI